MILIDREKCVGCGMCIADCIAQIIKIEDGKAAANGECLHCGHCVAICPEKAVSIPEYDMEDVEEYDAEKFDIDAEKLLRSIKFRRSVRNYKQMPVKREDLEMLVQAGRYTATAKNNQNTHFVFVQDEISELKERVYGYIDYLRETEGRNLPKEFTPYLLFSRRRKANPSDDFLFRNAPCVLFITSDWPVDPGLAAQNIENMAVALGMGALYNGYLARIADDNAELKKWLGIEDKHIKACMLLGYPDVSYVRTAPRKPANVIWK